MKTNRILFVFLWLIVGLWCFLHEAEVLHGGFLSDTPQINYIVNIICIMTGIGLSWLAYKWEDIRQKKKNSADNVDTPQPKIQRFESERLLLNAAAILPSAFFYYAAHFGQTALYCMLIALAISLFCFPKAS